MILTSILYLIYCGLVTINSPLTHESLWGHPILKDGLILQIIIVLIILIRPQININIIFLGFITIVILTLFNIIITDHPGTQAGIIVIFSAYLNNESFIFSLIPLVLIGNRSSLIAIIPLLKNNKFKVSIILIIISLILTISSFKMINAPGLFNIISSGRLYHYQIAVKAIVKNPSGYGFNGYRYAYPKIRESGNYLLLGGGHYQVFGKRGKVRRRSVPFAKCHNIILDKILDVGIPGFLLWLNLIRLNITLNNKNLVLSYLIFTFFWYETYIISLLFWVLIVQDKNLYAKIYIKNGESNTMDREIEKEERKRNILINMNLEELKKLNYWEILALGCKTPGLTPHDILKYLDEENFNTGNWYNPPNYFELYNGPDAIDAQFPEDGGFDFDEDIFE